MKLFLRGLTLFLVVILIQLSFLPRGAIADTQKMVLTDLEVKVMPEFINPEGWDYNIPSLLVGYHGTFKNVSEEPFQEEIKVYVPTNLPQFTSGFVAQVIEETDEHLPIEYNINEEGQYISWFPEKPINSNETYNFILEFFSAPIDGEINRSFAYEYVASSAYENLTFSFYTPFRSENFKVNKEPSQTSQTFGMEIQLFEYSDVNVGEAFQFEVNYDKDNIVTTVEAFNDLNPPDDDVHAGFGGTDPEAENQQDTSVVSVENVLLIILSILIIATFVFIVFKKKNKKVPIEEAQSGSGKIINKEEEIRHLRKMLAEGQIDESTYKQKRAKLD